MSTIIAYGTDGGLVTSRREEQERIVACLRIIPASLVVVFSLMMQDVPDDPGRVEELIAPDPRGRTPLVWVHVLLYGEVHLDMSVRLALG